MKIDYPIANNYFRKISYIVGKEKMEDFNNVITEAFVFEWVGLLAAQHCVVRAVGMLLYRDFESFSANLSVDDKISILLKSHFTRTNLLFS